MSKSTAKVALNTVICILLAIVTVTCFVYKCDKAPIPITKINNADLKHATVRGFNKVISEDGIIILEKNQYYSSPSIILPILDNPCNLLIITFAEPLPEGASVTVQLNKAQEPYNSATNKISVDLSSDRKSASTCIKNSGDEQVLKLNISDSCAIDSISIYNNTGSGVKLYPNLIAIIALACILLLLLAIEKPLGFYRWAFSRVTSLILDLRELNKGKKIYLILRLGAIVFTAALVTLVLIFLTFNLYTDLAIITVFAVSVLAVIFQLAYRISTGNGAEPAKLFLVICLIAGIMFCFTAPATTHSSWDDEAHLKGSYAIATLSDEATSVAQAHLFQLRYRVADFVKDPLTFTKILVQESNLPINYHLSIESLYTAVSYSPFIAAILLSNILGADIAIMLSLCRFANLLAYAVIVYFAIKKLKHGGYIFSALCLMPATLFLACSISYDSWLTAWMAYAFACIISKYQQPEKKITLWTAAEILLAFFLGCGAKAIYCAMMLPLLFIGMHKFKKPSSAVWFKIAATLMVVSILAILFLPGIFSFDMYSDPRGGENVNSTEQIKYVLTHPFNYAKTLLLHMANYVSLRNFVDYSAGYGFLTGYVEHPFAIFGTISAMLLAFSILTDTSNDGIYSSKRNSLFRFTVFVTCFIQVVLICSSMYAGFTDVGATYINGCQFRYLYPILIPLCYIMTPKRLCVFMPQQRRNTIIFGGLTLNLFFGYLMMYIIKIAA